MHISVAQPAGENMITTSSITGGCEEPTVLSVVQLHGKVRRINEVVDIHDSIESTQLAHILHCFQLQTSLDVFSYGSYASLPPW